MHCYQCKPEMIEKAVRAQVSIERQHDAISFGYIYEEIDQMAEALKECQRALSSAEHGDVYAMIPLGDAFRLSTVINKALTKERARESVAQ